jgi:hypothetical protein
VIVVRSLFVVALLAGAPAWAEDAVVSEKPDSVTVTLYHGESLATFQLLHADQFPWIRDGGLAFVTERRTIDLPAGPATIKFENVASTMVPQTAAIDGLPKGVIERNFDYDLLSPGALLAKSVGQTVRLVRTDSKSGKLVEESAIVRSGPDGVVFEVDGKFEALNCSGLPEKLVFDDLPGGLTDKPTLSVRTVAPAAGRYTISLSYIATGLNWSADYVARLQDGSDKLALNGWLTLANFSTTNFSDAPVDVVAGRLQQTGTDKPVDAEPVILATQCWPTKIDWATYTAAYRRLHGLGRVETLMNVPIEEAVVTARKGIEARALGDYKQYKLPEPTTLAAQETKQIQFLDQPNVSFEHIYRYDVEDDSDDNGKSAPANVIFAFHNSAEAGLGEPLPAGFVSFFETRSDGTSVFLGQHSISDKAVGLPVEVETGRALDVQVSPRLVRNETTGHKGTKEENDDWEVAIENDKAVPITFELRQGLYDGAGKISTETQSHTAQSGMAIWRLPLGVGERIVVRYTIEHPA